MSNIYIESILDKAGSLQIYDPENIFKEYGVLKFKRNNASKYIYCGDKCSGQYIYLICIDYNSDSKILKIGSTYDGIAKRFSSYKAGTDSIRAKGTCSITNYEVSNFIRENINDYNFHIFGVQFVPDKLTIGFYNKNSIIEPIIIRDIENLAICRYEELFGGKPYLNYNNSKNRES